MTEPGLVRVVLEQALQYVTQRQDTEGGIAVRYGISSTDVCQGVFDEFASDLSGGSDWAVLDRLFREFDAVISFLKGQLEGGEPVE